MICVMRMNGFGHDTTFKCDFLARTIKMLKAIR